MVDFALKNIVTGCHRISADVLREKTKKGEEIDKPKHTDFSEITDLKWGKGSKSYHHSIVSALATLNEGNRERLDIVAGKTAKKQRQTLIALRDLQKRKRVDAKDIESFIRIINNPYLENGNRERLFYMISAKHLPDSLIRVALDVPLEDKSKDFFNEYIGRNLVSKDDFEKVDGSKKLVPKRKTEKLEYEQDDEKGIFKAKFKGEEYEIRQDPNQSYVFMLRDNSTNSSAGGGMGMGLSLRIAPKLTLEQKLYEGINVQIDIPEKFYSVFMVHEIVEANVIKEGKRAGDFRELEDGHSSAVKDEINYVLQHYNKKDQEEYFALAKKLRDAAKEKQITEEVDAAEDTSLETEEKQAKAKIPSKEESISKIDDTVTISSLAWTENYKTDSKIKRLVLDVPILIYKEIDLENHEHAITRAFGGECPEEVVRKHNTESLQKVFDLYPNLETVEIHCEFYSPDFADLIYPKNLKNLKLIGKYRPNQAGSISLRELASTLPEGIENLMVLHSYLGIFERGAEPVKFPDSLKTLNIGSHLEKFHWTEDEEEGLVIQANGLEKLNSVIRYARRNGFMDLFKNILRRRKEDGIKEPLSIVKRDSSSKDIYISEIRKFCQENDIMMPNFIFIDDKEISNMPSSPSF